jgi:hypothetical protein
VSDGESPSGRAPGLSDAEAVRPAVERAAGPENDRDPECIADDKSSNGPQGLSDGPLVADWLYGRAIGLGSGRID